MILSLDLLHQVSLLEINYWDKRCRLMGGMMGTNFLLIPLFTISTLWRCAYQCTACITLAPCLARSLVMNNLNYST